MDDLRRAGEPAFPTAGRAGSFRADHGRDSGRPIRAPAPSRSLGGSFASAAMALVSAALFAGLVLRIMTYDLRRDEELYVPPTRLLDDRALYADVFYNHTPGSAWLFHGLRRLTGSEHLLLDARLGVVLGWAGFALAIVWVAHSLTRSLAIGWSIAVLFLLQELFLTQAGMTATNNFLPLPLSFLGLGLAVIALIADRPKPWAMAGAGFCLALAVVFKVSAVAFLPIVVAGAFLLPRDRSLSLRLRLGILPLALGGLAGGAPILVYLVVDPIRFIANVAGYHTGPHLQYYRSAAAPDEGAVMSLAGKLLLGHGTWIAGAAIGLVALVALLLLPRAEPGENERPDGRPERDLLLFVLATFVVASAFSLLPTPSFPQYFAPPLICLPLALILAARRLPANRQPLASGLLAIAAVVTIGTAAPRLLQHAGAIVNPGQWTVMRVHRQGQDIARVLAAAGLTGKVATLAPVYPLEGGLPVYDELATGPFAYRTAEFTAPELARHYRMTSPATVGALLAADPPAALLLGFSPELERPMLDFATSNGYLADPGFELIDRYGTARLYLRPNR